jgi:exodeoxyribonuclease VII small subunit
MSEQKFQFDEAMKELEAITTWFESSDVDLDQGLVKFERGMELAARLKEHLATVENLDEKIKVKFSAPVRTPALAIDPDDGFGPATSLFE